MIGARMRRRRAERDAEQWFVRRQARGGEADAAFLAWHARSPENAAAWQRTVHAWERLGTVLANEQFTELVSAALQPAPAAKWRASPGAGAGRAWTPLLPRLGVALALLVAVSLGVAWRVSRPAVWTTADAVQEVSLADGTRVHLDRDSRMRVLLRARTREVQLDRGRALFEVAPDAKRPFSVTAGPATVVATGTSFQVDRAGGELSVALLSGEVLVSVDAATEPWRLEPGARIRWLAARGQWEASDIDPRHISAWTRGFLEFDRTPLAEAIREVNRHGSAEILLAEPALGELLVSGTFRSGEARRFAEALPHVLPVRVSVGATRIVVARAQ